jgi:hypothetical protein
MRTINWDHLNEVNQYQTVKIKINILFQATFECVKHSIESSFKIVVGNIIKVKVKVNMNKVSLKPVMEVVVNDERGYATHPLQPNRYNSNGVGENFWPVFSGRREATKNKWLDGI